MSGLLFLAEWGVRSAALIAMVALALQGLRVKNARVRLGVWVAALGGSLALPLLAAGLARTPLRLIRIPMPRLESAAIEGSWASDGGAGRATGGRVWFGDGGSRSAVANGWDWMRYALLIYGLVAGSLLAWLCAGLAMSRVLLRRSRATGEWTRDIEVLESEAVETPLALGIGCCAIVLPCDWREWESCKLAAVLAHERSHLERRDPLAQMVSAIHRALLWHNPLSWFLHSRIVRAAEEASDDAAVAETRDRASYAEMLIEFMQRGARGAGWEGLAMARYGRPEARIYRILDDRAATHAITRRHVAAMLALGVSVAILAGAARVAPATGAGAAPSALRFEWASIRRHAPGGRGGPVRPLPGGVGYMAQDASLKLIMSLMYKVPARQITGGPSWLDAETWDVEAQADGERSLEDLHMMFRNLLADRFGLRLHQEIKRGPVYALVVDARGVKMRVNRRPESFRFPISWAKGAVVNGSAVSMQYFAWWLCGASALGARPAINRTGLRDDYDFTLAFAPELPAGFPRERMPRALLERPSLFEALQQQLGLRLQEEEGPVEYLVIDKVMRAE